MGGAVRNLGRQVTDRNGFPWTILRRVSKEINQGAHDGPTVYSWISFEAGSAPGGTAQLHFKDKASQERKHL